MKAHVDVQQYQAGDHAHEQQTQHWCGENPQISFRQPKLSDLLEALCASLSQAWQVSHTV